MNFQKLLGYILAIASAVSFGLIPLFVIPIKQGNISMDTALFYRFLFSALILLIYLLFKRESLKLVSSDIYKVIILGIIYSLSSEFLFWGYDVMSAGIASTVLYIYPMVVAVLLYVIYGDKINRSTLISIVLALIGVGTLSIKDGEFDINFLGLGVVLLSALAYSSYMIMISKANIKATGFKVTFYSLLFSSIYYLIKVLLTHQALTLPAPSWYMHVAVFAFVTTVISVLCLIYAIRLIGSTKTAVLGAVEPVIAVGVSVILFGESLTWNLTVGVVIIIFALVVNVLGDKVKEKAE